MIKLTSAYLYCVQTYARVGVFIHQTLKTIMMGENKSKQRDLESGDNPEERKKISGKAAKKQEKQNNSQRDLESGDNPEEREKMSGK